MFRLANIPHDNESTKDLATFLSSIASKTIYDALESWAPSAEAVCSICELYFTLEADDELTGTSFFKGTGQYFYANGKPLSDEAAGEEILYRKISRMKEKMRDPDKVYTFDVFEEYIFVLLIECAMSENMAYMDSIGSSHPQMDDGSGFTVDDTIRWMALSKEERETADQLKSRFQYSEEEAERTARQVHRIYEMGLDDDEDDNMFFWDTDMEFLFQDGFVRGIQLCAGAEGTLLGYGYEYTEEIFTDMGIKPPIRLLGTKEASRLRYEILSENRRKMPMPAPAGNSLGRSASLYTHSVIAGGMEERRTGSRSVSDILGITEETKESLKAVSQYIREHAKSKEDEEKLKQEVEEILSLGKGREMDRYDQTPRKIRCITRGFRYDDASGWARYLDLRRAMEAGELEDIFKMPGDQAARKLDIFLETMMEEPEAGQLVPGELYTLRYTTPDIGFGQGRVCIREIQVKDEFYDGLGMVAEDGLPMDQGLHCSLFEELEDIDIETRIRHRDEYWKAIEEDMGKGL